MTNPDTLNKDALEAAQTRPVRLHHPKETAQSDLFSRARRLSQIGGFGYECADFLEDITAYLAEIDATTLIERALREAKEWIHPQGPEEAGAARASRKLVDEALAANRTPAKAEAGEREGLVEKLRSLLNREPQFNWSNTDGSARQRHTEAHYRWAEDVVSLARPILSDALSRPVPEQSGGAVTERCFICDQPLLPGQLVLQDMSEGLGHRACFGEDREGFVKNIDTGEPLGPDDPLPTGFSYDPQRVSRRAALPDPTPAVREATHRLVKREGQDPDAVSSLQVTTKQAIWAAIDQMIRRASAEGEE